MNAELEARGSQRPTGCDYLAAGSRSEQSEVGRLREQMGNLRPRYNRPIYGAAPSLNNDTSRGLAVRLCYGLTVAYRIVACADAIRF